MKDMDINMTKREMTAMYRFLFTTCAMAIAVGAHAQSAGTRMVKVGANQIAPQVTSGDLSAPSVAGSKVDIAADTESIVSLTYMYTDQVSVEAFAGLPYVHDIRGDGAMADVGRIGQVKQVSPTVFAQYRANAPTAPFRPYVGLGLTLAHFYGLEGSGTLTAVTNPGGEPTKLSLDSRTKLALSTQLGASFRTNQRWFFDVAVIKTFISNTARLSTGQAVKLKLDPLSVGLSMGYEFP